MARACRLARRSANGWNRSRAQPGTAGTWTTLYARRSSSPGENRRRRSSRTWSTADHRRRGQRARRRGEAARRGGRRVQTGFVRVVRARRVPRRGRGPGLRGGAVVRQHLLTLTFLFPLVGASRARRHGPRTSPPGARPGGHALVTFGCRCGMLRAFDTGPPATSWSSGPWVRSFGLQYLVGVDGISLFLVLADDVPVARAVLASWKVERTGQCVHDRDARAGDGRSSARSSRSTSCCSSCSSRRSWCRCT